MERATQVCSVCNQRKKKCDKALPACGYCAKRDLECLYYRPSPSKTDAVSVGSISDLLSCKTTAALDGLLNLQVCHVIHRSGVPLEQLSSRFFGTFHQWLPIVSPVKFLQTSSDYQHGVPSADFSLLLLAMYAVVLRPSDGSRSQLHEIQPRDIYLTARLFLVHVQASVCASIRVVQATLLLTSVEYACGKPEAAHISLGMSFRMCEVLGLQHGIIKTGEDGHHDPDDERDREEQRNVWWATIIMERLIALELPWKRMRLAPQYPNCDFAHPTTLEEPQSSSSTRSHNQVSQVKDSFADLALATFYLDAVLAIVEKQTHDNMYELDKRILEYLGKAMKESSHGSHSEAISVATRSLILLHEYILNELAAQDHERRKSSEDALDTAACMILQAASHHKEHFTGADALALSCSYNLETALKRYEQRPHLHRQTHIVQGAEAAQCLSGIFRERWPSEEPKH